MQYDDSVLFSKDVGFDIGGGKRVNLTSPAGWTTIFTSYRQYIEDIVFDIQKVDKGIFVLPIEKEKELNKRRLNILDEYSTYSKKLVAKQNKLLDSDPLLRKLNNDMLKELELDPKDIIMQVAQTQKIKITEITDGQTTLEKTAKSKGLTEPAKEFLSQIKLIRTAMDNIILKIDDLKLRNKLDDVMKSLNNNKARIDDLFNRLIGTDRVSVLSDYNKFVMDTDNLVDSVNRKREAGSAIKGNRFVRDGITVPQNVKGALSRLNAFTTGSATQFTSKRQDDLRIVLENEKLKPFLDITTISRTISELPPDAKRANPLARQIVKEQILDKVLIAVADE